MNKRKTIGIIAGSLRKESFSKKIATAIVAMAPVDFTFQVISLDDLPVYNQDFDPEEATPDSYRSFRESVQKVDGLIFVTPEHNRSIPAALKNALDVGSRPAGKSVWNGKPAAVISNSPGRLAAFGAHHHLRQVLVSLNIPVLPQPEVYLAGIGTAFDDAGTLVDEKVKEVLQKAIHAYILWFSKF